MAVALYSAKTRPRFHIYHLKQLILYYTKLIYILLHRSMSTASAGHLAFTDSAAKSPTVPSKTLRKETHVMIPKGFRSGQGKNINNDHDNTNDCINDVHDNADTTTKGMITTVSIVVVGKRSFSLSAHAEVATLVQAVVC